MITPPHPFGLSKRRLIILSGMIGVLCALYASRMATYETRWIILPLFAIVGAVVVVLVPRRRLLLLGGFFLATQLDLHLYLGLRGSPSIGSSTPEAIVILSVALAGIVLFLHDLPAFRSSSSSGEDFRRAPGILKPALVGIGILILSGLFASERYLALCSLVIQVQMVLIFLIAANVIRSESDLAFVFRLLMATLVIQCLIYLLQSRLGFTFSITGQQRIDTGVLQRHGGTVGSNPSTFASFTVPLLFMAIARFLITDKQRTRWLFGGIAALGVVTLILTFTRAAWSGFAIGCVVLGFVGLRQRSVRLRPVAALVAMGTVAVVALAPLIAMRLGASLDAAATERFTLNKIAFSVIKANPWLGVGPGGYGYAFRQFIPETLTYSWLYIVHNAYLLRAAETGIFGLIAMIWLLVAGLREAAASLRAHSELARSIALGLLAGISALMWEMLWDIWSELSQRVLLWQLLGILVALKAISAATEPAINTAAVTSNPSANPNEP